MSIFERILEVGGGGLLVLPLLLAAFFPLTFSIGEDDIDMIRVIITFVINAVVSYVSAFCFCGAVIGLFPARLEMTILAIDLVTLLLNVPLMYPMFILSQIRKFVKRLYKCVVKKHR